MTDRIWSCPSPDDCQFTTTEAVELAAHINSEHAGEFKRDDWPDTAAGRLVRAKRGSSDDESEA